MQTKLQLQVDLVDYLYRTCSECLYKPELEDIVSKGYTLRQAVDLDPDDEYFEFWDKDYTHRLINTLETYIKQWEREEPDCDTPQELIDEVVNNINLREE